MFVQSKQYYEETERETIEDCKMVDMYAERAENWKKLYEITKGHKGIYKLLNKLAYKRNRKNYEKGMELALKRLGILGYEIGHLEEYLKSFNYLEDKGE